MQPHVVLPPIDDLSAESATLTWGFALRRFPPELEAEYLRFTFQSYQQTRRKAIVLLLISIVAFIGFDLLLSQHLVSPTITLPAMVLRLCALLIIVFAASRVLKSPDVATGDLWIPIALGSLSLAMLLITVLYLPVVEQMQLPFGLEGMMLIQMAIFFPIGYSYRKSLYLALATLLLTYVAIYLATAEALSMQFHVSLAYLVAASVAAGAAGYCHEHSMRTLFLTKRTLRNMADTDGLTQLYNRRSFDLLLQRALQEAQREHNCIALIMLDLDHFKAYNDLYGHPAGDLALQRIAGVLAGNARRGLDFAARLGGEEFALVLHNPDRTYLASVCESIRQQIHNGLAIEHLKNPAQVMTASLGASFSQADDSPTSLYQRADEALYRAKAGGRNRVEID